MNTRPIFTRHKLNRPKPSRNHDSEVINPLPASTSRRCIYLIAITIILFDYKRYNRTQQPQQINYAKTQPRSGRRRLRTGFTRGVSERLHSERVRTERKRGATKLVVCFRCRLITKFVSSHRVATTRKPENSITAEKPIPEQ